MVIFLQSISMQMDIVNFCEEFKNQKSGNDGYTIITPIVLDFNIGTPCLLLVNISIEPLILEGPVLHTW